MAPFKKKFPCRLLSAQEITALNGPNKYKRENYPVLTVEYVTSGAGFLEINGKSFHIHSDSIYFLTPGSSHCYWPDKNDPWQKIFFVIYGELVNHLLDAYDLNEVYHIPAVPELKKYFREMIFLRKTRERDSKASIVFHSFCDEAAKTITRKTVAPLPALVEKLKKRLDTSLDEPFSLKEFAAQQNCKASSLIRSFRRSLGKTPHAYLIDTRISEAVNYLRYTDLSVKEIACILAFSDQYHFSNTFKQHKGCSPSEFRSKHIL